MPKGTYLCCIYGSKTASELIDQMIKPLQESMSDIILALSLLFLIWFVFHFVVKQCLASKITSIRHPPSPPGLPIIGHIHLLSSVLPNAFRTLANLYGPLMRLRFVSASAVVVSDAATAKELLKHNEMNFLSRPDIGSSGFNIYDGSSFVFAEYGDYWCFMKKLCMTELLSVSQVNRFAHIRREEIMKLMEKLVECSDGGNSCDLGVLILTMTNNVICKVLMSTRCSGNEDESKMVWEFIKEAQDLSVKFFLGKILGPLAKLDLFRYGRRLRALLNKFDSLIEGIMAEHEKNNATDHHGRKDVMDILLQVPRDEKAEIKLTRADIKCFLLEFFMAGTDTTSVALQWTIAELINNSETFKKVRNEIDSVVGVNRLIEESDVPNLPYLQSVVKEALRIHPPAPLVFRKSEKDCKINGYDILANERVILNLKAIMRDPNSWENPDDFVPERFMMKSKVENYDHHHMYMRGQNFGIIPFGTGRRGCPGAPLSLAVIHAAVGILVQCFDFKVGDGKAINMEEAAGFSTPMAYPLMCYPVIRINPFKLVAGNE